MNSKKFWLAALFLCLQLLVTVSVAQNTLVLGDLDGDLKVNADEVDAAEQAYDEGKMTADELDGIKYISENYPRSIVDSAGNEITIYKPLEQIMVFNRGITEALRSIKAQDKIVAIDDSTKKESVFLPEISQLPSMGKVSDPDEELILESAPDAVFHYATIMESSVDHMQETLNAADPSLAVIRLDLSHPEKYVEEVEKLGYLMDKEEEAQEYIDFYNGLMNDIKSVTEGLSDEEKPEVYWEMYSDYQTVSMSASSHQKVEMAGGKNIFADLPVTYSYLDPEELLVKNPDIVIKLCGAKDVAFDGYNYDDFSQMEGLRDRIMSRPGWDRLDVVTTGRVYMISNDIVSGSKHFIGVAYLAKLFHPDKFQDLDPVAIHQQYLSDFQGLDYDLNEHGAFLYPPVVA